MKKIIFIFTALSALSLTGCYDAIFQSIRDEVRLEAASVSGYVNSIVRFQKGDTEYLYLQNGRIYYKDAGERSHGKWLWDDGLPQASYNYYDQKFDGYFILKLAADQKHLYALGYIPGSNPSGEYTWNVVKEFKLWYTEGDGWNEAGAINERLKGYYGALTKMNDANIALFCTNSPKKANRKAYIRIGADGIIELDGASTKNVQNGNGASSSTVSAVFFKNKTIFLDTLACATDETKGSEAAILYFASGTTLYYTKDENYSGGTEKCDKKENIGITPISMALTKDSLLFGTDGYGIYKMSLDAEKKPSGTADVLKAAGSSALSSPYIIRTMLCTDPSVGEAASESAIYCSSQFRGTAQSSSTSYSNVGLWSYYGSRGNWNRE